MTGPLDPPSELRAGAGRAEILLPTWLFPIDGFTGAHDPLHVRALLLDDGRNRLAIVSIELTSLTADSIQDLREIITATGHVDADQVVIAATHTFSAPHLEPASGASANGTAFARSLAAATEAATASAVATLRAATLHATSGRSRVAVNRDVHTVDGWWLGADDAGTYDADVPVVRLDAADGDPIAIVFSYAVQSSVMNESYEDDGGRLVTADLAGAAARYIERHQADHVVALFLVGAAGDQAPYLSANRHVVDANGHAARVDAGSTGHLLVEMLGERLGRGVTEVARAAKRYDITQMHVSEHHADVAGQLAPVNFRDLRPSTSYSFVPSSGQSVSFWLVQVGPIAIVAVQPELSAITGLTLKRRSPFPHTVIATMTNGAAKYLPDAQSYDRISYEAMSARYARGSAETVVDSIIAILEQAHRGESVSLNS